MFQKFRLKTIAMAYRVDPGNIPQGGSGFQRPVSSPEIEKLKNEKNKCLNNGKGEFNGFRLDQIDKKIANLEKAERARQKVDLTESSIFGKGKSKSPRSPL